ncbi:Phage integrase [Moorella thermoacetica ATCC] [Mycobacterium shimoidei]|uniref:Phage integrase [Moorella thermoacetica ATCC] n=1 Tax=Mycobacterium shimoidei TaxID=29313 RepID=A0A375Z1X8_MYCSH|nr:site-specific integrase [Mycobacterium shimoidei]SRX95102.1 Phage integrase [Moorella thermoacetica ATCC] [Mycobacterium shimoidei]
MAYIRAHDTTTKRKGKTVKRYEVCWRETATDANGLPIPGKTRARQESYPTREAAEARRDELNHAKHNIGGTAALADAKKAAARPFAEFADGWLARQHAKVSDGDMKQSTYDLYQKILRAQVLPRFGGKAIGAITVMDCEQFRADLVTTHCPRSVRNVWQVLRHVLRYAYQHNAIIAVPTDAIDRTTAKHAVGDKAAFEHKPLTAPQVAALAAKVGERYPVYELLVLFMAYTGLRAAEVQGLEVRDLMLTTGPDGNTRGSVRVQRTKTRRKAQWVTGTPKSKTSKRAVPLPPWLATRMAAYLADTHADASNPTAPLWPRRGRGNHVVKPPLEWSGPLDLNGLQSKIIRPALEAIGLPASRPARAADDGTVLPATNGVRLHDLRHTAAVLWLTNGVHFLQVSKWLGHSSYVLTLTTYADYIPDVEVENPLPEPVAPAAPVNGNVVPLRRADTAG